MEAAQSSAIKAEDERDPNYEGKYEGGLFEGRGIYTFPGVGKYVGEFSRGMFHGEGTLFVPGGSYPGRWERGKFVHGTFMFEDGLSYKKVGQKTWEYCSKSDPRCVFFFHFLLSSLTKSVCPSVWLSICLSVFRFYSEIKSGIPKSKANYPTSNPELWSHVPEGCYDTGDGYFHPKKMSIFDYRTSEELRVIDAEERDWIINNCRQNPVSSEES